MQTIKANPTPRPNTSFFSEMLPVGNNSVYGYLKIGKKVGLLRARARLRGMPQRRCQGSKETLNRKKERPKNSEPCKVAWPTQVILEKSFISFSCLLPTFAGSFKGNIAVMLHLCGSNACRTFFTLHLEVRSEGRWNPPSPHWLSRVQTCPSR